MEHRKWKREWLIINHRRLQVSCRHPFGYHTYTEGVEEGGGWTNQPDTRSLPNYSQHDQVKTFNKKNLNICFEMSMRK